MFNMPAVRPKVETDSVESDNTAGLVAGTGPAVAALGGGIVLRRRSRA